MTGKRKLCSLQPGFVKWRENKCVWHIHHIEFDDVINYLNTLIIMKYCWIVFNGILTCSLHFFFFSFPFLALFLFVFDTFCATRLYINCVFTMFYFSFSLRPMWQRPSLLRLQILGDFDLKWANTLMLMHRIDCE